MLTFIYYVIFSSKKDLGGGAVLDLGVYVLQFAQFIFKEEPTKVTAVGALNEEGVDIIGHFILQYSRGRRAVLNIDSTTKLWNKATVTGTNGRTTVSILSLHSVPCLIILD